MAIKRPRPAIPSAVKRQLRQEAGYGCCFCGYPFVEYHHIIEFAEDPHFRVSDMMLVCSNHHHLCTVGALPDAEQRAAKLRPKNIADGLSRGTLFVNSERLVVAIAGGLAINIPNLLVIFGEPLLSVRLGEEGRLLISARIENADGERVGELVDNEWSATPSGVWDFEARPQHVIARSARGQISLQVDCAEEPISLTGNWHSPLGPVRFSRERVVIGGNRVVQGTTAENYRNFIHIKE